jgi:alpha-galactosidase
MNTEVVQAGQGLRAGRREWIGLAVLALPKFGDMSAAAAEIKKIGMRPGLWTRPLLTNNNNDKASSLDPTLPETLQRIGDTIRLYREWGYELVKHDYSTYDCFGRWGFQMKEEMTAAGWHFNDRSRTNAERVIQGRRNGS